MRGSGLGSRVRLACDDDCYRRLNREVCEATPVLEGADDDMLNARWSCGTPSREAWSGSATMVDFAE
jgi:hypothetical protein